MRQAASFRTRDLDLMQPPDDAKGPPADVYLSTSHQLRIDPEVTAENNAKSPFSWPFLARTFQGHSRWDLGMQVTEPIGDELNPKWKTYRSTPVT